ncbi:MAG: hypothetical protein CSB13_02885 [Chloroflexi bacterium]|nr:MAG: hypothetical protein CSB13_02885 [Chloroflexota bacterium]
MIQPQTQNPDYWGSEFKITDSDIEQIYNHFLEAEKPQTVEQIALIIISHRLSEENARITRLLANRTIYQPKKSYEVGEQLVFPVMNFAHGEVTEIRDGFNPSYGKFNVIQVDIKKKQREFAADLDIDHPLNAAHENLTVPVDEDQIEEIYDLYGYDIEDKIAAAMEAREEFMRLGRRWFVTALMAEVNVGHLHLSQAILEMYEGGPLPVSEILPHLDMDPGVDASVQAFSLNYALLKDERFDEVAPKGHVAWFLHDLEPEGVKQVPERLAYDPISFDRALLGPQFVLLERELDDEWSNIPQDSGVQPVVFTLMYPHRRVGALPLSSRIRPLFPLSNSPRQRAVLVDDKTGEEIVTWIVKEHRYIYGLKDWYEKNKIPIGGFVHLTPEPDSDIVKIGFDRRKAQREWVRLATVSDNRIKFELMRRAVSCGYDDLLIVGTDVVAAVDALWRRVDSHQRSVASLLAELFPELANLNPQNTVHAKTLYSAINMLKRLPPGPIFAELVRNPAFQPVGDHYWRFDSSRWQKE